MSRIIKYNLEIKDNILVAVQPVYEDRWSIEPEDLAGVNEDDFLDDFDWEDDFDEEDGFSWEDDFGWEDGFSWKNESDPADKSNPEDETDLTDKTNLVDETDLESEQDEMPEMEMDEELEKMLDDYLEYSNRLRNELEGHTEYDEPDVEEVIVPEGIIGIGEEAFKDCTRLKRVILPNSVKVIEDHAFCLCKNLERIELPEQIEGIGEGAFLGCRSLGRIRLPKGLKKLENKLFLECEALENVEIPESVEEIGDYVFERCPKLTELHLPHCLQKIGKGLFYADAGFESLVLPAGVTAIHEENLENGRRLNWLEIDAGSSVYRSENGMLFTADGRTLLYCSGGVQGKVIVPQGVVSIRKHAFFGCGRIEEIQFPDSVEKFGVCAFSGCRNLRKVVLPPKLRILPEGIFLECEKLEDIMIHEHISYIAPYAFWGCKGLENLVLPSSVRIIGNNAFERCMGLKQVEISEGTWKIGKRAFDCGWKLHEVRIPVSVEMIDEEAFGEEGCADHVTFRCHSQSVADRYAIQHEIHSWTDWTDISYEDSFWELWNWQEDYDAFQITEDNLLYKLEDGILYSKDGTVLVRCSEDRKGTVVVPHQVQVISSEAFCECKELERVILPEGLLSIGNYAFYECNSLIEVTLPESLLEIGEKVFGFCEKLKNIQLPNQLQTIGTKAFWAAGIEEIALPSSLTCECGEYIFWGCENLRRANLPECFETLQIGDCFSFFRDCRSLECVTIRENGGEHGSINEEKCGLISSSEYYSIDGIVVSKRWNELVFCPPGRKGVLRIPEGVTGSERDAFLWDCKITGAVFPASWKEGMARMHSYYREQYSLWNEWDGCNIFKYCSELEFVEVHPDNLYYTSKDGLLLTKDGKMLLYCPNKMQGVVKVPEGVESIALHAFDECSLITEIFLPKTYKNWDLIVKGCVSLKEVKAFGNMALFGYDIEELAQKGAFDGQKFTVTQRKEEED